MLTAKQEPIVIISDEKSTQCTDLVMLTGVVKFIQFFFNTKISNYI